MASSWYDAGVDALGTKQIDLTTDDIRVILIDADDYTVDLENDAALDDIPAAARVSSAVALTGKTFSGRVFSADDTTLPNVSGDDSEALGIYLHTGTESTSTLLLYIDNAAEFPITPIGTNINITWDSGPNGIAKL